MDSLNHKGDISEREHYLYTYPHIILKNPQDQLFKYANKEINDGELVNKLSGISDFEWNKVIIENEFDEKNYEFNIKVYLMTCLMC